MSHLVSWFGQRPSWTALYLVMQGQPQHLVTWENESGYKYHNTLTKTFGCFIYLNLSISDMVIFIIFVIFRNTKYLPCPFVLWLILSVPMLSSGIKCFTGIWVTCICLSCLSFCWLGGKVLYLVFIYYYMYILYMFQDSLCI